MPEAETMEFKVCHNCGESMVSLKEKCPRCGIIPDKSRSPVMVTLVVLALVAVAVVAGLVFL